MYWLDRVRMSLASTALERQLYPRPRLDFRFRPYEPRDREAVILLHDVNAPDRFPLKHRPKFVAMLDSSPDAFFVVELSNGEVVAACGVTSVGDFVHTLCYGLIAPAYQGRAIGSTMTLARLVSASRQPGDHFAFIYAVPKSIGFYRRFGFEENGAWLDEEGKENPIGVLGYSREVLDPIESVLRARGHLIDPKWPVHRNVDLVAVIERVAGGGYRVETRRADEAPASTATKVPSPPRASWLAGKWPTLLLMLGALGYVVLMLMRASSTNRSDADAGRSNSEVRWLMNAGTGASESERAKMWSILRDENENGFVRELAVVALGRARDPQVVTFVLERLPDAVVHAAETESAQPRMQPYMLAKALYEYAADDPNQLAPILRHADERVVEWAVFALGFYRGNDAALALLAEYLTDARSTVRSKAAYALSRLCHPAGESIIVHHLRDADTAVRQGLAWALQNCGTAASLPALEEALAAETDAVTQTVLERTIQTLRSR